MAVNPLLRDAVLKGDRKAVQEIVGSELQRDTEPVSLIDDSMTPALRELGERFSRKDIDLPDLLVGARAMQAGLDLLGPRLAASGRPQAARVCIGTVQGDRHDIGKNVVAMILRAHGYEVDDLGADCGAEAFAAAVAGGARAVLCSVLMTTCLQHVRGVVDRLAGRPDVPVLVGGAAASADVARTIGAAAYGADANEAVALLGRLLKPGTAS